MHYGQQSIHSHTSEVDVLQMDHNKSYQAASFKCTISTIPERPIATSTQECYETQS